MENDALHILLADDDEDDRIFFKEALQDIRVKTKVTLVNDGLQLMNYLNHPETAVGIHPTRRIIGKHGGVNG